DKMSLFELPDLPYDLEALEPYIDARTLDLHHRGHHATYVKNLNLALEDHEDLQEKPLEYLLSNLDELPEELRTPVQNNGGGHFSHSLFWEVMTPNGNVDEKGRKLMDVTKKSLYLGIEQAQVGNRIGDIGHAIQTYAEGEGFSVVREFTGHGIGPTIHEP